jgi:uncharacterized protein (TIGR03000 family)
MITRRPLILLALPLTALLAAGAVRATLAGAGPQATAQAPATATATRVTSRVNVTLPQSDAELLVNEQKIEGNGDTRQFNTTAHERGSSQKYTFTAKWQPNSYTTMTRTKDVSFRAGDAVRVDLAAEGPDDRVRVIYVPTPQDVSEEMIRLARVTASDVLYEPGCGDARITIAGIRAGARRGICIDIDPERAAESRNNVKNAGYADRIDVRLGDALDLKDLSDVTVVLLYMGDHFDMLIRPVLWRDLKVGSRIVSHRFLMGDWKPDRTISYQSTEGGIYDLHLWTITEEVKRRAASR